MRIRSRAALAAQYLRQMRRSRSPLRTLIDLPPWLGSQSRSALSDGRPWVTYGAARALRRIVTPSSRVLEFGAGGSTVFFGSRCLEVVSVEHDAEWADAVRPLVDDRVEIVLAPPLSGEEVGRYGSTDPRYSGMSFRAYAGVADRYPDAYFDLLLIDGRARPAAFAHAHPKVREGGWVVLDNSDRDAYIQVFETARSMGWSEKRFRGPHPYVRDFGETTIWVKRA